MIIQQVTIIGFLKIDFFKKIKKKGKKCRFFDEDPNDSKSSRLQCENSREPGLNFPSTLVNPNLMENRSSSVSFKI